MKRGVFFQKNLEDMNLLTKKCAKKMFGRTNADIIEYAIGEKPNAEMVEKLAKEKEGWYRQMCLENPETFILAPGAEPFLDYLKANNIPMTIATMSEWDNVEFYIKEFKLSRWFDIDKIVYSNGKIPGKPAPDIYEIAAKNIGLKPQDCIVVEDAISGINAANSAQIGMIIAIASVESDNLYKSMPCVRQIIHNFDEIDKTIFK